MRKHISTWKGATATRLRSVASRLAPPIHPYGEWDPKTGQLVIKVPQAPGMQLARIDISPGMIHDRRMPFEVADDEDPTP